MKRNLEIIIEKFMKKNKIGYDLGVNKGNRTIFIRAKDEDKLVTLLNQMNVVERCEYWFKGEFVEIFLKRQTKRLDKNVGKIEELRGVYDGI